MSQIYKAPPLDGGIFFTSNDGSISITETPSGPGEIVDLEVAHPSFRNIFTQVFTVSGTYTPSLGMAYCFIECISGGGAGGGAMATNAAQVSTGGGGGSGTYAKGLYSSGTIGVSQPVTIGAGGVGVSGAVGGNGGSSSVGTLIVTGLGAGASASAPAAISGGRLVGGQQLVTGSGIIFTQYGWFGSQDMGIFSAPIAISGAGAPSRYGFGGQNFVALNNSAGFNGNAAPAVNHGAGGGGALNIGSNGNRPGGNGAGGQVIITEFCT